MKLARLALALLSCGACLWGVWNSGREGLAQLFAAYGATSGQLEAADRAVELSPAATEAHSARARLLFDEGELAAAVQEYERALMLRPQDYVLWLELGRVREQAGDAVGAVSAFREAVRLAPYYAQPHWQLGNTLYRAGRLDEAFAELRRATASDERLLPPTLDLAWAAYAGDAKAVEQAIRPQTPGAHLALARYFAKQGKTVEAVSHFRAAGQLSTEERRALLSELLAQKHFAEAYEVWSAAHPNDESSPSNEASLNDEASRSDKGSLSDEVISSNEASRGDDVNSKSSAPLIFNGGFEQAVNLDDPGFGWQLASKPLFLEASQDTAAPRAGRQSLRLVWNGNAETNAPFLSQLLLVQPHTLYRLHFAARTEDLVTAGLPQIVVNDVSSPQAQMPGAALTLPQGTSPWQDYNLEFKTGPLTSAVQLIVRRQACATNPCPIFGRVWLDEFSLTTDTQR